MMRCKLKIHVLIDQWRIQDFPMGGGMDLIGGAWTPEAATFQKFCIAKRKNLDPGHAPSRSADVDVL